MPHMNAAPALQSLERRALPRAAVMREGRAFRPDGLNASVLIIDLSDGGARLRPRGAERLPDLFVLADPATFLAHQAQVVWRRDGEMGLRLLRSQNLRGVVPGALLAAKAFCEARPR